MKAGSVLSSSLVSVRTSKDGQLSMSSWFRRVLDVLDGCTGNGANLSKTERDPKDLYTVAGMFSVAGMFPANVSHYDRHSFCWSLASFLIHVTCSSSSSIDDRAAM